MHNHLYYSSSKIDFVYPCTNELNINVPLLVYNTHYSNKKSEYRKVLCNL